MITGRVESRQALLPITYRLPGQPDLLLEHVVDTGFTGELTLPPVAQYPFITFSTVLPSKKEMPGISARGSSFQPISIARP